MMQYLKKLEAGLSPIAESEQLDARAAAIERLVIGLRRIAGINKTEFQQRTGLTIEQLAKDQIAKMVERRWIIDEDDRIRLTRHGLMISDWIASQFLDSN